MRKISLFFILSMLAVGIHAQELTERELQAKEDSIFNLKFSEEAHYAETAVELIMEDDASVSVARQQSMLLLQTHIVEIFSKCLNMKNQDVQEIWDLIEEKGGEIEIQRGDLFKVCKYIAKDALKGWLGSKKLKPLTPEDSLILFGPKETKVLLAESTKPNDVTPEPPVIPDPPVKPEPSVKSEESKTTVPSVKTDVPTKQESPMKPEESVKPEPVQEVVVPDLCEKIIAKGNFQALMGFLEQEKAYGNLVFGGVSEMQYLSKCYVVALERANQKIAAVHDKGNASRMNFMTKKMDYHGNYKSDKYALIFIQEY